MTQIIQRVTYDKSTEETYNDVLETVSKIGRLRETSKGNFTIHGSTRYGLQTVYYGISVIPYESGSVITFNGESDDFYGKGATNAFERLQEGILNLNNPNYEYKKNGMSNGDIFMKVGLIPSIIIAICIFIKIASSISTSNLTASTTSIENHSDNIEKRIGDKIINRTFSNTDLGIVTSIYFEPTETNNDPTYGSAVLRQAGCDFVYGYNIIGTTLKLRFVGSNCGRPGSDVSISYSESNDIITFYTGDKTIQFK